MSNVSEDAPKVEIVAVRKLREIVQPTHGLVRKDGQEDYTFARLPPDHEPIVGICLNPAASDVGDVQLRPYHVSTNFVAIRAPLHYLAVSRPEGVPEPTVIIKQGEIGFGCWRITPDSAWDGDAVVSDLAVRCRGEIVREHFYVPIPKQVDDLVVNPDATYALAQSRPHLECKSVEPVTDYKLDDYDISDKIREAITTPCVTGRKITEGQTDLTRSAQYFSVMKSLLAQGIPDNVIFTIFCKEKIGEPLLEKGRDFRSSFIRELNNAKKNMAPTVSLQREKIVVDGGVSDLVPLPNPMPRRQVLVPGLAFHGLLTMIVGKGGEGKSLFSLQLAAAVATGTTFAHWEPTEPANVLYINIEDNMLETQRRLAAICEVMDIDPDALRGKLFKWNVDDIALVEKDEDSGEISKTKFYKLLLDKILNDGFGMVIIDPLIECHRGLDENSNTDMKEMAIALRALALAANVPVIVIHHGRKNSAAGDQDSARGGSALVNACRVVKTLEVMSEDEASKAPLGERSRLDFVRVTDAKQNYAKKSGDAWVYKQAVTLPNGEELVAFVEADMDGVGAENFADMAGLVSLVATSAPDKKPWRDKGTKANRLDEAVMRSFKVKQQTAQDIIARAVREGAILQTTERTSKNRGDTVVYRVPDKEKATPF